MSRRLEVAASCATVFPSFSHRVCCGDLDSLQVERHGDIVIT